MTVAEREGEDWEAALMLFDLAHSIEPFVGKDYSRWPPGFHQYLRHDGTGDCPLTHAARVLTGEPWSCGKWDGAADALGIPRDTGFIVTVAADHGGPDRPALAACYGVGV